MRSRDIGCGRSIAGREQELCNAIAASMRWTWMGHAIVSPGWRWTWDDLRNVYCHEHVGPADLATLERLSRTAEGAGGDWRLEDGAASLARMVRSVRGDSTEPENSIFNPANSSYILAAGCRG